MNRTDQVRRRWHHRYRGELGFRGADISARRGSVALGLLDGNVHLLDERGRVVWRRQVGGAVWSVAIDGEGHHIAAGGGEADCRVWLLDTERGDVRWQFPVDGGVRHVRIGDARASFYAACTESTLYVIDQAGELIWSASLEEPVRDIAIAPDGRDIALCAEDGRLRVLRDRREISRQGPVGGHQTLCLDGTIEQAIAVREDTGAVCAFDAAGRLLWQTALARRAQSCVVASEAHCVAVGVTHPHGISLLSRDGQPLWHYSTGVEARVAAITPDGRTIIASTQRGVVALENRLSPDPFSVVVSSGQFQGAVASVRLRVTPDDDPTFGVD